MAKQNFHVCYHCKDRHINCHSTCELYLKEVEENNKRLKERQKELNINDALYKTTGNRLRSIHNKRHLR